jgi:hypothetical protein
MSDFHFFKENHIDASDFNLFTERLCFLTTAVPNENDLHQISQIIRNNYSWKQSAETLYQSIVNKKTVHLRLQNNLKAMINFQFLESNKEQLRLDYLLAKPFPYLVIDNFCDEKKLELMYNNTPELSNKSRDYMFANNKFEKSNYRELGSEFEELYNDLSSKKMNDFLSFIANEEVFVDQKSGGGLLQGKKNSFIDMP